MRSKSTEHSTAQITCSTSENNCPRATLPSTVRLDDDAGCSMQLRGEPTILDPAPTILSSLVQRSETTVSSIVIIPTTLTEEQKLQYDVINVASSGQSQHSFSEMTDCIDPNTQYLGGKSTIPDETREPDALSQTGRAPTSAILLSSSPQIPSASRRMKRAKSEIGMREFTPSAILESSSKITKRRGRSKTIAPEEMLRREASVDELSLSPIPTVETVASKRTVTMKDEKQTNEEVPQQRITADEHFSRDGLQLEEELDKPRTSLRRSKSMSAQSPNDCVDLGLLKPKKTSKKPSKASKAHDTESPIHPLMDVVSIQEEQSITTDKGAINTGKQSHQKEALDCARDAQRGPTDISEEIDPLPTMPIVPNQPKKRGRKKTSEMIASKQKETPQVPNPELFQAVRKALSTEPLLRETDHNIQASPAKDLTSTPPVDKPAQVEIITTKTSPNAAATAIAASVTARAEKPGPHTPTKDAKKGAEQHSPLQNGRVPYRVGLSKRTRIAPLLKIIRK
jgi:hypothetical protein